MKIQKDIFGVLAALALLPAAGQDIKQAGVGPGPGIRYATDAYPGFDSEDAIIKPERKEPKWFAWINGPNRETPSAQFAYCQDLVSAGDYSKARKHLDALVRQWPTSPEAPKAQLQLADVCLNRLNDCEDAFAEYRYLLDFYSLQCDYNRIADTLYDVAGKMREEGKFVMFVRFANTVDVRRAYETCVLRAPGAAWVTDAMLTIASLRIEEGKLGEAVKVLENLRNLHPNSHAAKTAVVREAEVRMQILREHEYNRARCQDTIDFLKLALTLCDHDDVERIGAWRDEAVAMIEEEAFKGAKFYDSNTRTRRSSINAYEQFLREYPASVHADEVRSRLEQLKGREETGNE